jgi:hypothetical protein
MIESLRGLASASEGFFSIELGPVAVRRSVSCLSPTVLTTSIMQRLQRSFDPHGILHPERLFGRA